MAKRKNGRPGPRSAGAAPAPARARAPQSPGGPAAAAAAQVQEASPSPRAEVAPPPPDPKPASRWSRLRLRTKIVLVFLVAVLGGWSTIRTVAVDPLVALYRHRQPAFDQHLVGQLRTGVLLSETEAELQRPSVALLRNDVDFTVGQHRVHARDELFILDSVYVEAFVDDHQTVLGYTITERNPRGPGEIEVGDRTVILGKTSLADATDRGVAAVVSACGAHILAYYHVLQTSNADLAQTVALGYTNAGAVPGETSAPGCPPAPPADLPEAWTVPDTAELYVAAGVVPSEAYLKQVRGFLAGVPVNTIAITASGVDLAPEMISLHPSSLPPLDPDPSSRR